MHLEEQSLDEIMANSELLVSCYYIIESAVSYMASDRYTPPYAGSCWIFKIKQNKNKYCKINRVLHFVTVIHKQGGHAKAILHPLNEQPTN